MNRVVVMDLNRYNTVLVDYNRYFVLESEERHDLVLDRCPHRGGPLSLARLTPDGRRLTCPWHGTRVATAALRRKSVPMVRSGREAVIVFTGVADQVPITLVRRHILANLPAAESTCGPVALDVETSQRAAGPATDPTSMNFDQLRRKE